MFLIKNDIITYSSLAREKKTEASCKKRVCNNDQPLVVVY